MISFLWNKTTVEEGCWVWNGARTGEGYGNICHGGRWFPVHRLAYTILVGPIPEGMQLDHLCRKRPCWNPEHLEPVTNAENTLRGLRGRMVTKCAQGHPYNIGNTGRHGKGRRRHCLECNRLRSQRYYSAKKLGLI